MKTQLNSWVAVTDRARDLQLATKTDFHCNLQGVMLCRTFQGTKSQCVLRWTLFLARYGLQRRRDQDEIRCLAIQSWMRRLTRTRGYEAQNGGPVDEIIGRTTVAIAFPEFWGHI